MSTATCHTPLQETAVARLSLLARIAKRWDRHAPRLDVEALPEHLLRDLGFAGGRPAPRRDPLYD